MTENNSNFKRVTCKRPYPNQHFHNLLQSLYRDAIKTRSTVVPALEEAISSLERYPLHLSSGAECIILKGFDQRLCRYIDSHISSESSQNKKSKLSNNGASSNNNIAVEEITESSMTSKDNHDRNENSASNNEPNNNNNQADCLTDEISAPENSKKVCNEMQDKESDLALCEGWGSFNCDHLTRNRCRYTRRSPLPQPIIEFKDGDNEASSTEDLGSPIYLSSDDESIGQPIEDQGPETHTETVELDERYDDITAAADSFQLYYKEKVKRDAEELGKCVLPRNMYKPEYGSGAYAILAALLEQRDECPFRDWLTKDELIQKAQRHTKESFTIPKLESNYTAWANARRLINKGMIQIRHFENSNEDFYTLTALGRAVVMELVKDCIPKVTVNDVIFQGHWHTRIPSVPKTILTPPPPIALIGEEQGSIFIEMPPGTFDIFMLIDKRENVDKNIPQSPSKYCKYEARSLAVGDYLWVARSRKTGQELVLPYIVERKRLDDLASSIKDGRFHEQKFRLRKCGLKNVIYLIENVKRAQLGLPISSMRQAVVNTSILDEFNILQTGSLAHTFLLLGILSEQIGQEILPSILRGCNRDTEGKELMTFEFFNKFSCKNKRLTVRDTFIKMLLQLKGLSVEKALAITNKYGTPRLLMKAYGKCTEKDGELLLANLKYNNFTRTVGPGVSKTVYKLFSKMKFD